jgi:hypothetical protein
MKKVYDAMTVTQLGSISELTLQGQGGALGKSGNQDDGVSGSKGRNPSNPKNDK